MAKQKTAPNPLTPAAMGALRWKGTTKAQRTEIARAAIKVRWEKKTSKKS